MENENEIGENINKFELKNSLGIAGGAVGGGVILEIEKESEHLQRRKSISINQEKPSYN